MNVVSQNPSVTKLDLKAMAKESGPCLSLFLAMKKTENSGRDRAARLKSLIDAAETKALELGLDKKEYQSFVAPVLEIAQRRMDEAGSQDQTLAIYRSTEATWDFFITGPVEEHASIGDGFIILPLIRQLADDHEFYLLALSQKHTRLIHCTELTSEEVTLPVGLPVNLQDFHQFDTPDQRSENRSHGGQQGNAPAGLNIAFGTGADHERKDQYLRNFFNEMDKQLQTWLRERPLPLVIAGVDYELAIYHKISEYPMLVEGGVSGAPDGLKGGEIHARALEVMKTHNASRADRTLAKIDHAAGDRVVLDVKEAAGCAFDGRILTLVIAEDAQHAGGFDEVAHKVIETNSGGDLINWIAFQTIAHGGDAYIVPREKMPSHRDLAALLRY